MKPIGMEMDLDRNLDILLFLMMLLNNKEIYQELFNIYLTLSQLNYLLLVKMKDLLENH